MSGTPMKMSFFSIMVIIISALLIAGVINAQNNQSRLISSLQSGNEPTGLSRNKSLPGTSTSNSLLERDRNKIPPTTPRVKFPDRLDLKGENGKTGWQSKDRVAAILCWYCITTWSPQYCISLCHRHWLR
ncbi:uncharacterized protein [Magallana gigas]|uniref:uncharacterized protein n=1 Tax=Magallana gigas TaxID=29159 RepID=UPI003341B641